MYICIAILLPLLGGALLPLFKFKTVKSRGFYVEAIVILTGILCWYMIINRSDNIYNLYTIMDNLTISFRLDGMSCVFLGLVSFLWPLASLYGFEYMTHEERPNSFFAFYTMTYSVTIAVATAANLFTLYMFFECLTLITLPLVTHKQDAVSNRAGRKYVYFSISGAAMAFTSLVFIIFYSSTTNFTLGGVLDSSLISGNENLLRWAYVLAFVGFGTKAAVLPMSKWLPAASVAPTPVTALLHAVAVVNTGAFAVIRVTYYSFGADFLRGSVQQYVVLILACVTILYGSSMAVKEQHFKRRLAYSTISNLSYMLMGAALMTPAGMVGSLSHLVFHGIMKIMLFYCAGAVLVRTEKEYVQDLRGFSKVMPFTAAIFTLGSIAMVGIPPFCGFISKWNLLTAAADCGPFIAGVAITTLIVSAILTAIYLFSVVIAMYFRPLNAEMAQFEGQKKDPSWMMKLPFAILAVTVIVLGVYSGPLVTFLKDIAGGFLF